MCPYMQFIDGGRRYQCGFCNCVNEGTVQYRKTNYILILGLCVWFTVQNITILLLLYSILWQHPSSSTVWNKLLSSIAPLFKTYFPCEWLHFIYLKGRRVFIARAECLRWPYLIDVMWSKQTKKTPNDCLEQAKAWAFGLQGLLIQMLTSLFESVSRGSKMKVIKFNLKKKKLTVITSSSTQSYISLSAPSASLLLPTSGPHGPKGGLLWEARTVPGIVWVCSHSGLL